MNRDEIVEIVRIYQIAKLVSESSKTSAITDQVERLLTIAKWSKPYSRNVGGSVEKSLTLDWSGLLGGSSATKDRDTLWNVAMEKNKQINPKANLAPLRTRTLPLSVLSWFSTDIGEEEVEIIKNAINVQEAIQEIYTQRNKVIHRKTIEELRLKTKKPQPTEKPAKPITSPSLVEVTIKDLTLVDQAIEATKVELARLLEVKEQINKQLAFYAIPPNYELPAEGNQLVVLELNGYSLVHQSLGKCVMQKGSDSIILNVDAWTEAYTLYLKETSKVGEDKLLEAVTTVQPFYIDPVNNEWNYTNIAIHLYNQLNVLISPQILQHLDFFKNNNPKTFDKAYKE